jgi:benzoyl-CoA reductase/2-hydroxyglutaryl-CoA dehydratase subunit BcrC/BadD/HgdB
VPRELPAALGLVPVFVDSCAVASGVAEVGETVGSDSCSFCRALLGASQAGAEWLRRLPLLIGGSACDQQRRLFESIGRQWDIPVHGFVVPRTRSENAFERYLCQLKDLVARLEGLSGTSLRPESLAKAIAQYRRLRLRLRELRERMRFSSFARLAAACFQLPVDVALELLEGAELPSRPGPPVRLMLAGSCATPTELEDLDDCLRELGAEVVADALPTLGALLEPAPGASCAALEEVARVWFDQPDPGTRPNEAWFEYIKSRADAVQAQALIYRCLRFCDLCSAEAVRLRETLAPLPVLVLDEELGAGKGAAARRRTRIEALLEGLRCPRA